MLRRMVGGVVGDLEAMLGGWPDTALTVALLAVAAVLIFVAFSRSSLLKAAVLAWVVLP